jgi:hypothetical protein
MLVYIRYDGTSELGEMLCEKGLLIGCGTIIPTLEDGDHLPNGASSRELKWE